MKRSPVSQKGITLFELIFIIIIISILAVLAIAKYHDFITAVKVAVVKNNLSGMRRGIRDFYIENAVNNQARYPTAEELSDAGGGSQIVSGGDLPGNIFDEDGVADNVVIATTQPSGTVIGTSGGWAYRASDSSPGMGDAGQIWANTATTNINENQF